MPELPRYAVEPVRIESPEGFGPWLRTLTFILLGVVFALGFLLSH